MKDPSLVNVSDSSSSHTYSSYPLFHSASFASYPLEYVHSLANVLTISEPTSYSQAIKHKEWINAKNLESIALEKNDTCELTSLPKGK